MSLADVMKKLEKEDPNKFRDVMADLEYQGKDPAWLVSDLDEAFGQTRDKNGAKLDPNSITSLTSHRERLTNEKAHLAAELHRIQDLLKI